MIILSIDAGENQCGYAVVRREQTRARYLMSGLVDSTRNGFLRLLGDIKRAKAPADTFDCIVIETPDGYVHTPYRAPGLLRTSRVAGGMVWIAEQCGYVTREMTAEQWRKPVSGKGTSGDDVLVRIVRANIIGMPASVNVHVLDALGMAMFATTCCVTGKWPEKRDWNKKTKGPRVKKSALEKALAAR